MITVLMVITVISFGYSGVTATVVDAEACRAAKAYYARDVVRNGSYIVDCINYADMRWRQLDSQWEEHSDKK